MAENSWNPDFVACLRSLTKTESGGFLVLDPFRRADHEFAGNLGSSRVWDDTPAQYSRPSCCLCLPTNRIRMLAELGGIAFEHTQGAEITLVIDLDGDLGGDVRQSLRTDFQDANDFFVSEAGNGTWTRPK